MNGEASGPPDAGTIPGGGEDVAAEVEAMAARLRKLAAALRDPELDDQRAATLAREAADLVAEAGNRIDRALSEADDGGD